MDGYWLHVFQQFPSFEACVSSSICWSPAIQKALLPLILSWGTKTSQVLSSAGQNLNFSTLTHHPIKVRISTHQALHLWYWWSPRLIPRIFWTPTPLSALETSKVRRSGIQTRLTHVQLSWSRNFVQKIGRVIFSDRSSGNSNYDTWYPWVAWKMWSMSSMIILCVALKVST